MRSHLTRSVFRCLLSNEPLIFRCPSQSSLYLRKRHQYASPAIIRPSNRRSFFGMTRKAEKEQKEAQLDPGLAEMVEFSIRQRLNVQLPPRDGMVAAWRKFFEYKKQHGEAVTSMQAGHALKTYEYLRRTIAEDGSDVLGDSELKLALRRLQLMPKDDTKSHAVLARLLYKDYMRFALAQGRNGEPLLLVEVLTRSGNAVEASKLIQSFLLDCKDPQKNLTPPAYHELKRLWRCVLWGFVREGNEAELLKTTKLVEDISVYGPQTEEALVSFYAERDNFEAVKEWYGKVKSPGALSTPKTISTILHFCIRNDQLDWCKDVFRDLLAQNPPKNIWDVILQWAAGALGKGVEDVERLMETMKRVGSGSFAPDATTINGLVELAISVNKPYLAERYIVLGQKFGIQPDAKTYILQMQYRADAQDLRGAQAAYERLQSEEVLNNEDLPAINKYIRALCSTPTLDYDQVVTILGDLTERGKHLEAETTSALIKLYLARDQNTDLINIIQTESYRYTYDERALIREVFMDFCLSPDTSTDRSWIAYTVLHPLFNETTVEQRTLLMNEYFSRGRCDMATHVFGHMRAHDMPSLKPVLDTYTQCFLGIASCADLEALNMVYNMLKLDSNIEPNTALYNSLMLAFTACDDADRAVKFWDDITNSREGPSYQSLEIVFWACSRKHYGDTLARETWDTMKKMEIEITGKVFSAYAGALAGNSKLDEVKKLCESAPKDLELNVDMLTLGTVYNAIPGQNNKDLVEVWAKAKYPAAWKELEKIDQIEHEEGHRLFDLKREFKA